MELVQGLFCGKTQPIPQPETQSGTDYSLRRDLIAGSIKIIFLSTCFLLALSSSTNSGSHAGMYKVSNWKRKQQVMLREVLF